MDSTKVKNGEFVKKALRNECCRREMKEAAKNNILRIDCQLQSIFFYLKALFLAFTAVYQ
jgi:hypothetical protein